jgi:tetratricopeptide (TPR) repeat protein
MPRDNQKVKPGTGFERRVAETFRSLGARRAEHNVQMGGNQIDVCVELETSGGMIHKVAVEAKDWASPVGVGVVNDFAQIAKLLRQERLIDEGAIVSSIGFTVPARQAAKTHAIRLYEIADLDALAAKAEETGRSQVAPLLLPRPPDPHFAHPYPMQVNFTGRVREREMLTQWVVGDDHPVLAMVAMGGMGKSAVTWAWVQRDLLGETLPGSTDEDPQDVAHCRVPDEARFEGVLWWSFYERDASCEAFLNSALAYVSSGQVDPAAIPSAYEKMTALLTLLQQKRFLIVLDGLERQLRAYSSMGAAYQGDEVTEDAREDYRSCTDLLAARFFRDIASLPMKSRVLVTSRLFPRELDDLAGCRREDLQSMDPDDAVRFFRAQGIRGTRAEMQAACEPYGYLPLALRLLAGRIVKDKRDPGDIRVAKRYPVAADLKGKEEHHILEVAYSALRKTDRSLLSCIAAFRGPVTYDGVLAISPYTREDRLDGSLDDLIDRGLLFHHSEENRYDLHPVVRRYAYDRLGDKKGVHTRLRDYFATIPAPDDESIRSIEDLAPVIELYHHTVRAGGHDEALDLYRDRLGKPLYYRFGGYETCITLLSALFPEGEDRPPRLRYIDTEAWAMNGLANCYCRCGQPRRAARLYEESVRIDPVPPHPSEVSVSLENLAGAHLRLGELASSDRALRRSKTVFRLADDRLRHCEHAEAAAMLLAYTGAYAEAAAELDTALAGLEAEGQVQIQCVVWSHRATLRLLEGNARAALDAARRARGLADKTASTWYPHESEFVQAEWLLGASLVALAAERNDEHLAEAETHLTEAINRCRRVNMVDLEPDILLSWAKWHRLKGDAWQARRDAEEALEIADRCEYRLKQADVHNFLAQLDLDDDNKKGAIEHADIARERAWCQGPIHSYKPALDEAERLLKELGAPLPALPPYKGD